MMDAPRPISLAILAMGGQGGGVLSDWIVRVGEGADLIVQSTSVPGVAQRTGATIYYLELFPRAASDAAARRPVLALMPVPGDVDIVMAGELVEAGRAMVRGLVVPGRTTLITSSHRDFAIAEKMAMGDGRVDGERILETARARAGRLVCFDMAALAEQTGSVISAVLLGALAGSGAIPIGREVYEQVIREGGVAVQANLAGFDAGYRHAREAETTGDAAQADTMPAQHPDSADPEIQALLVRLRKVFPESTRDILLAGVRRLVDYQDARYANHYLDRLVPILEADNAGAGYALTRETGRHLALWMSYEDAIRIADLKTRKQRFQRVRKEVRAQPDQIVYITEFLHPRLQEICDILPARLGKAVLESPGWQRVIGWFCRKGRRIPTNKLHGFLLLSALAGGRRWRRVTLRFQVEQECIEQWLASVRDSASRDGDLALEVARCQQLIKGYGETHERGMASFKRILEALARIDMRDNASALVKGLREAALADEHGHALTAKLQDVA